MTQMGLDYVKHMESKRHNLATEGLDAEKIDVEREKLDETRRHNVVGEGISQQEADTKEYVASFEDRKTSASEDQARAATIKAETEAKYAERKVQAEERKVAAGEKQAEAALTQAEVATVKADLERMKTYLNSLSAPDRAANAAAIMGYESNDFNNTMRSINTMIDSILGFVGRIIA